MNRQTYLLLPLIIVCLSIPLAVNAQVTQLEIISGDSQTGQPGQALKPFVVKALDQNGDIVRNQQVHFLPAPDSISVGLSDVFDHTDDEGLAQTTVTLRSTGTATIIASVGTVTATFTATGVTVPPPPAIPTGPLPPSPPIQTKLIRISGDDQEGLPGKPLANPFVVQVLDEEGDPFEGAIVRFSVLLGGGSLSATTPTTGADGQAESILTLGTALGTNKVQANVEGISQVLVFSAEATTTPSVPTVLSIISGENQTGVVGETLANPFVIKVRNGNDTPVAGVTVTFTVLTGSGTLSATTGTTDANGQTESTLTLGSEPGTNTVEIRAENIEQTVTFNAEATLPPPTATSLQTISGGEQDELTGGTLMDPSVVEVHDQDGNPLEDVPVTFTILEPDGSVTTTTATTNENGRAEFTLPPNGDPGTYTITASVEGIAETVTFIIVVPLEFDLSLPAGLNLIHIPLRVRTIDGMPAEIQSVSDLYDALGGAATLNWLITHDPEAQTWHGYFGDADRGTIADAALTDQTGVLASAKTPISIRLAGDALGLDGTSAITLNPGLNLVGLPLNDPQITRVSDLLTLEGVGGNIGVIIVTDNSEFKLVGRADDPGDIEITGGQAFILIAQGAGTIPISGDGWQK